MPQSDATLCALLSSRSWLADELIDYLAGPDPEQPSGLVGELDLLPLFLKRENRQLTIRNTFIQPTVLIEQEATKLRRRRDDRDERDTEVGVRPSGPHAEAIYKVPIWLKPPWR